MRIDIDKTDIDLVKWEKVIKQAIHGQEVLIQKSGKTVAKITPVNRYTRSSNHSSDNHATKTFGLGAIFWWLIKFVLVLIGLGFIALVAFMLFSP